MHIAPFITESVLTVADISVLIIEASSHKYKTYTSKDFFLLLKRFRYKLMVSTYMSSHAVRELDFHKNYYLINLSLPVMEKRWQLSQSKGWCIIIIIIIIIRLHISKPNTAFYNLVC